MVDLENFKKCMGHITTQMAKDDVLSDVLVCEDTSGWISTAAELIDDVIDLMADSIKGEETADWISWWLWEVDRDKPEDQRNNKVWIKDEDGVSYKYTIEDLDDLYYLITDDFDKIKTKVQEEAPEIGSISHLFSNAQGKEGKDAYEDFLNTIFPKDEELN